MKNDDQISNVIVSLLLEFKEIMNSKDDKHFIVDNLSKRVDNYKNYLQLWKIIIELILPNCQKKSSTESNKRKTSTYEQKTRCPVNEIINIKRKKEKSCGFCNTTNHTANICPTSRNIEQIIDGDLLAEFLQDTCPFIVIESDIYANVFCESLDLTKVQQLKCHQLLSNIIPNRILTTYL